MANTSFGEPTTAGGTKVPDPSDVKREAAFDNVVLPNILSQDLIPGLKAKAFVGVNNMFSMVKDAFTDKEDMRRLGSYWTIGEEGRIFFLRDYPYHTNNSVIVSYIAGDGRVPSSIHEATTKLVAAEILRSDDQSVLITETGANISTKEKYDILRKEGLEILKGKADLVYFID